ncbi:hypothetical protein N7466_009161 [Penicillium verhagenii]|uniref:uncharacterized protein n=1 Tax=Penicillium verhagenii TaxID=1562060 RepID=UPI002545748E|nr:uncharacterized protein N7466_009161 [Penicillium verhagenii]KAJ5920835.1 hypothetical protein N7466_009161 [Penicillium verhagenii]
MILVINQTSKGWKSHTHMELARFGTCLVVGSKKPIKEDSAPPKRRRDSEVARVDSLPYKNFPAARFASVATQEDPVLNNHSPALWLENVKTEAGEVSETGGSPQSGRGQVGEEVDEIREVPKHDSQYSGREAWVAGNRN